MKKSGDVKNSEKYMKNDFSYPKYEEWKDAAIKLLKGKDFSKSLNTKTYEGITLNPIYTKKDLENLHYDSLPGMGNFLRGQTSRCNLLTGWGICQRMASGIPEEFNKELVPELKSGQNTIFITPDEASSRGEDPDNVNSGRVGVDGQSLATYDDIENAFKDININDYPVVFDTNVSGMELLMLLFSYTKKKSIDPAGVSGLINFDPIGFLAKTGELNSSLKHYYEKMALMIKWIKEKGADIRIVGVSTLPYHNSGANAAQEIAIALSTGVEYLEVLGSEGISPSDSARSMSFRFGIGSNFFMEIAKLRGVRVLWNRILREFEVDDDITNFHVHAETSMFNQSSLDPYVNMLRVTTETFSAVIGGAALITTNPFDRIFTSSNEFSRRVARNVQIVLREESNLHKLIDPTGGSYYVEKLTSEISGKAWEFFLEIEKEGGVSRSLESGFLQDKISGGRKQLEGLVARRKKVLVGTNSYGNPNEELSKKEKINQDSIYSNRIDVLKKFKKDNKLTREGIKKNTVKDVFLRKSPDVVNIGMDMISKGLTIGEISRLLKDDSVPLSIHGKNFNSFRLSENMEKLRLRVDLLNSNQEIKSEITIAVNEPFIKIKPRGDFAKSFFESGGMKSKIISLSGTFGNKAKQILEIKNRIIVVCASDDDYTEFIPAVVPLLKKSSDKNIIVFAGNPGDRQKFFVENGIDMFIFHGVDLHKTITEILEKLGVKNV